MLTEHYLQGRDGNWYWEVSDDEGVYLRSEHRFECELEAQTDLMNATHLIRANLTNF